jgi:cholesterol transport system auxiliary component
MRVVTPIVLLAAVLYGCSSGPNWKRQAFAFSLPADAPVTNAPPTVVALNRVSISPLFQSRSFTYRTADNTYEQDPYAGFLIPPERSLAESIRAWMRASGAFGRVLEAGRAIMPTLTVEVSIQELYADFRKPSQPVAIMALHFMCYESQDGVPRRIVLDKFCTRETPLASKTPAAVIAAWDTDLRQIMQEIDSEYGKALGSNLH